MKNSTWPIVLLFALVCACGGEEASQNDSASPGESSATARSEPIDAAIPPESVTLGDLEWFSASGHRISGLSGRITNEEGQPLAGGTVTFLIPPPVPAVPAREGRTVRADDDGLFRLDDVPQNARLRIDAEGAAARVIRPEQLLRIGVEVVPVALPLPGAIRGRVTDPGGTPVAGAELLVIGSGGGFELVTMADGEGRFAVDSAAPGKTIIRVLSRELMGRSVEFTVVAGETVDVEVLAGRPQPVTVEVIETDSENPLAGIVGSALFIRERSFAADERGRLVVSGACFPWVWLRGNGFEETPVQLPSDRSVPQTITMRVDRGGTVLGLVTDPDGQPIEGARARVLVRADKAGLPARGPRSAADGTFRMSWVPPGGPTDSAVFAEKPGHYLESATILPIRRGEVAEGATIVLGRLQRATLRVLRADGAPVACAVVSLSGVEPFRAGAHEAFSTRSVGLTDKDGRLTLHGIAPQSVALSVSVPGRFDWREIRTVERAEEFDFGEVRLPEGFSVAGRVRSTSGKLPEGTKLVVSLKNQKVEVDLGGDGSFHCGGLHAGPVDLRIKAEGHESLLRTVQAGAEDLDLIMIALGSIRVEVVRPTDEAIQGWLELRPLGGRIYDRFATTRKLDGKVDAWTFKNLPAGAYRVRIQAGDWYARSEVKLLHGQDAEAKLVLRQGEVVAGTLRLPDGSQAAATGVSLLIGEAGDRQSRVTDGFGQFEFRGVPPGPVTLTSHPTGYAPTTRTIEVTEGETTRVEVRLRAGGKIRITVRDASGAALPGVRASLAGSDGPARFWVDGGGTAKTDLAGVVTLIGVEEGEYDLSLFRSGVRKACGKVSVTEGETSISDLVWK